MKLRRAFAIVIALVAVVLGLAVVSGFQLYDEAVSEREQQSVDTAATAAATQVDTVLAERVQTMELAATDPVMLNDNRQRRATLRRLIAQTPFQGISVIRANGTMTAIESEGLSADRRAAIIGSDFGDRTYVQRAQSGQSYVSEPLEADTGNLIVTIATPVRANGSVVGVLSGALHVRDGTFLPSSVAEATTHEIRITAESRQLYASKSFGEDTETRATTTVATTDWTVTAANVDDGAQQTQLATGLQLGAGGLVLFCLVGFGTWFKRSNLNQIDELLAGFDRLADRAYGTQISVGGSQEWEQIGSQFNQMSRELARHDRELKQYREIVERVTDPIAIRDTTGDHQLANQALADYAGYDREEILGTDESLYLEDGAAERVAEKRAVVLDTREPVEYELTVRFPKTGVEATFSTQQYPYYDETGALAGTLSVYRDVTEREERARQLRVVDRVLRHNLRNDLTVISLEAERIAAGADGPIADSAEAIQQHADDLLTTSDKSRSITEVLSEQQERVDLDATAMLTRAASDIDGDVDVSVDVPEEGVQVSAVTGLREAVDELVTNAVVHNDHSDPVVELELERDEDRVCLRFGDNGPEIPQMDRDVLENGRPTEDLYHGSGLGLWLVYWTVQQSGGAIAVRSTTPRGTVVEIELPRA